MKRGTYRYDERTGRMTFTPTEPKPAPKPQPQPPQPSRIYTGQYL